MARTYVYDVVRDVQEQDGGVAHVVDPLHTVRFELPNGNVVEAKLVGNFVEITTRDTSLILRPYTSNVVLIEAR